VTGYAYNLKMKISFLFYICYADIFPIVLDQTVCVCLAVHQYIIAICTLLLWRQKSIKSITVCGEIRQPFDTKMRQLF
jgi:hypothetical protein